MRTPIAWLRDYVELPADGDETVARLATLGFPVDAVERRPALSGVFVGKITRLAKHPNADRLQICDVDIAREPGPSLRIVTAATNVAEGQIVPVAVVGAQLPELRIEPRKMRGVESQGMLCSAEELALEGEWFEDGILQLDPETPLGADVVALFHLDDPVLEVDVTPNRVDALSMIGLARELAAASGRELRMPALDAPIDGDSDDVDIRLDSPDCPHFVAQRAGGVTVRTAPFWMRLRLALAGQRPINNLVDISNFVMLETGQPLHFYDHERLAGRRLIVRDARDGERIETLDGVERTLTPLALVVADDERPQGLAGLMGAAASEVSASTREIVVESATFHGPRVRRMSVALGLRTSASSRHEKGVPPRLNELGAARAAHLLAAEGATLRAPRAFGAAPSSPAVVTLPTGEIERLLGFALERDAVERHLRALGFTVDVVDGGDPRRLGVAYRVTVPYWRGDVAIAADIVEELARMAGYDRIEATVPTILETGISSEAYRRERRVARVLASLGYRELVTLALEPAAVQERYARAGVALPRPAAEIRNPLSEDQRYLRFSLLPGFLELAARHRGTRPLRLFELGHVFGDAEPQPEEISLAALCLVLEPLEDEPAWRDVGFLEFKGVVEAALREVTGRTPVAVPARRAELHPGKTADLQLDDRTIATIGAVDPRLLAAFDLAGTRVYLATIPLADLPAHRVPRFRAPSRFPGIARDLALVVAPEVTASAIEQTVRASVDGLVRSVRVFDEYRGPQVGEGKKSLAVHILLQRDDATMTDREADAAIARVLDALRAKVNAQIRS